MPRVIPYISSLPDVRALGAGTDGITKESVLTIVEAAEYLHLHRRTVAKLIRAGHLRGAMYAGRWRISRAALLEYQQAEEMKIRGGGDVCKKG